LLWGIAVASYGIGDTLTTYLNISAGMKELNPLISYQSIIPLKATVLILLYIASKRYSLKLMPFLLIVAGIVCTIWNLSLLL